MPEIFSCHVLEYNSNSLAQDSFEREKVPRHLLLRCDGECVFAEGFLYITSRVADPNQPVLASIFFLMKIFFFARVASKS